MALNNIKRIAVLGAGVMGHSIAQVFARHGYALTLCDVKPDRLERALRLIESTLETLVEFERLSSEEIPTILSRIRMTTDLAEAVAKADLVIEAVPEIEEIKKDLFYQINKRCSRETIFASNTSGLNIFELAAGLDCPERMVITHWFSPPHIIPLVEVVPGKRTSSEVLSCTVELLKSVGKVPVVLKEFVPAFIVNRFQNALNRTAFEMIDNGWAAPEDIDLAIKYTLGIKLPIVGILQALDFTGLDLIHQIMGGLGVKSAFIEGKVKKGEFGAKTSKGIYDYPDRNEIEILKKRDRLYFKTLDHLKKIHAFEAV
ncbi:MAG: 3-hydroxyacyl-CoA dehydrogenase family protein [Pseudomonadota bacterium]